MFEDLVIVNLRRECAEAVPTALTNLQWQTCLRRIVFLHRTELSFLKNDGLKIYSGRAAYQFLLEVICGLHSPLLGENAVMGQFRKFRTTATFAPNTWGHFLRTLVTDLLVDARYVRHHHLQRLGSQSYGSLIRRYVKGGTNVAVLGAGSLAREILPLVERCARVLSQPATREQSSGGASSHQIDQFSMADVGWEGETASLVIAAPIDAAQLNEWLSLQSVTFSPILDLRGQR